MTNLLKKYMFSLIILGFSCALIAHAEDISTNEVATPETTPVETVEDPRANDPDPLPVSPPTGMVPAGLLLLGDGSYFSEYGLIAEKSKRTLTIWKNENGTPKLVDTIAMDYGKKQGDKMIDGDHKTPEGIYFFESILKGNQLDFNEYGQMAITMDYPNHFDQMQKKTGHGIWLHAVPKSKSLYRGSRGCLVVRNDIIPKIGSMITLKTTPILVYDIADYISLEEHAKRKAEVLSNMESWRSSWQNKDLDSYIGFYHEKFRGKKMNKNQWKSYKGFLNKKYSFIKVEIKSPIVLQHQDEMVFRFIQSYSSDHITDSGDKALYMLKSDQKSTHQIVAEKFKSLGQYLAQKKAKEEE